MTNTVTITSFDNMSEHQHMMWSLDIPSAAFNDFQDEMERQEIGNFIMDEMEAIGGPIPVECKAPGWGEPGFILSDDDIPF